MSRGGDLVIENNRFESFVKREARVWRFRRWLARAAWLIAGFVLGFASANVVQGDLFYWWLIMRLGILGSLG